MKRRFFLYLFPSVIRGGVAFLVMVPVSTYYLEPKDFGVIAILSAVIAPIGPLSSMGAAWVISGNYFMLDNAERKILLFNILFIDFVLKSAWIIAFWLSAEWLLPLIIVEYKAEYQVYFDLLLLSVWLGVFWPTVSYTIIVQIKPKIHIAFELFQLLAGSAAVITCLWILHLKIISLIIGPVVAAGVSLVGELWYIRRYVTWRLSKRYFREIYRMGFPSLPASLSETLGTVATRYFIQLWANLSLLGIYSHSQGYFAIINMMTKAFSKTMIPKALEIFSHAESTHPLVQAMKKWYGLLAVAGSFVSLFSYNIVNILTHGKFVAAAPLITIWFLLAFSFTYGMPYTQFLFVKKKSMVLMSSQIVTGLFFIGVTALNTYFFGIMGASISLVASNFSIHFWRRNRARHMGCPIICEKAFYWAMALVLTTYAMEQVMVLGLVSKIALFFLVSMLAYRIFIHQNGKLEFEVLG